MQRCHAVAGRRGNVLPGTVVDGGIVANTGFDFWLNSHAGLQVRGSPAV